MSSSFIASEVPDTRTLDLAGSWQLRWNDGERGERPEAIQAKAVDWSRGWSAKVPGSVHETLVELGVIPEPSFGANVLACRWVEETIWNYRREFVVEEAPVPERAWLVFDSLDLAARVFLNGKLVASHANSFYPLRCEVTDHLLVGRNELVIEVESGLFHAMHLSSAGLGVRMGQQLSKMPWLRKTHSQHGWDWSPRLMNVGIPGGVRLEFASLARVEQCVFLASVSEDLNLGKVTGRLFLESLASVTQAAELLLELSGSDCRVSVAVMLEPGMNRIEALLPVQTPELWWPVGHGSARLHEASLTLRVEGQAIGSWTRKIGFRHICVNQESDPTGGTFFVLEVNGKPIFCKGANYVPADLVQSRIDRERHRDLVDLALEANFNFLRVWGGGLYESDDFYDVCDEKGIMVWQDFIYACAKYPTTDENFLADVTREATYQIRRLSHRASLVVWCGNNELEMGCWDWGYEKGVAFPDYAFFHLVLPRLMEAEDPERYYQPSSPFSPGHQPANADHTGDQHPWAIGFGDTDFRKYRKMTSRFPNEGGVLGPNSLPTTRKCFPEGEAPSVHSFAWQLHDNSISFMNPLYAPDAMIKNWLGRDIAEMSIEDHVFFGGILHGEALGEYIRNFRRRMFASASAVFWMFNDVWPCARSWTIVDNDRNRTPAFCPVKRAFAPVIVVVVREGDRVITYGVNEGPEISANLRFGLMALAGTYPSDQTISVTLPANASSVLAECSAKEWDELGARRHAAFAVLSTAAGEIARDRLILPLFCEMEWPEANVRVARRGDDAVFTCDTFAWRVCLDLDGDHALADNFFDIYPGVPTVLPLPQGMETPLIVRLGNSISRRALR